LEALERPIAAMVTDNNPPNELSSTSSAKVNKNKNKNSILSMFLFKKA